MDTTPLLGQVALVTGGASGIGRACAVALADAGADVALLDVNVDGLAEAADEIRAMGRRVQQLEADLSNIASIPGLVTSVIDELGRIDILVNVAGIVRRVTTFTATEDDWDAVHTVNLKAPFFLTQHVGKHMVERGGGGKIVNVASSSAHRARAGEVVYSTSKAALVQLSRSSAAELAPHDVNVNTVSPGITVTPITRESWGGDEEIEKRTKEGPLANLFGRPSYPEDVAAAVLFLCLPTSRQITAQVVHTSAGLVIP